MMFKIGNTHWIRLVKKHAFLLELDFDVSFSDVVYAFTCTQLGIALVSFALLRFDLMLCIALIGYVRLRDRQGI